MPCFPPGDLPHSEIDLPILDISYQDVAFYDWLLFFYDWLLSISMVFLRFIHAVALPVRHSFLWLKNIPPVRIKPQFVGPFIYRWTFGMFSLLALVNSTAVNIHVIWIYLNPWFGFFLDMHPELELLSHRVILCLTFQTAILFFTVAAPFYILTGNA